MSQQFNAAIIGPTSINTAGWYNWELYYFCKPLGSTTWQFSKDGFNYGSPVGFGDMVSNYNITDANNGNLFLRCTINNNGQNYVTTTTINVNICGGCRVSQDAIVESDGDGESEVKAVFPNPANKVVDVDIYLKNKSDVELQLADITGLNRINKVIEIYRAGFIATDLTLNR
ncbi:hypothetical protein [Dyadobacter sp. 676]|uniref:T9SS type A sorting domain-containing protein n=1 Tax=Dyadobacter sp. 676 TaxID=3088362 RepID=A0AAU8FME3_9BACT